MSVTPLAIPPDLLNWILAAGALALVLHLIYLSYSGAKWAATEIGKWLLIKCFVYDRLIVTWAWPWLSERLPALLNAWSAASPSAH